MSLLLTSSLETELCCRCCNECSRASVSSTTVCTLTSKSCTYQERGERNVAPSLSSYPSLPFSSPPPSSGSLLSSLSHSLPSFPPYLLVLFQCCDGLSERFPLSHSPVSLPSHHLELLQQSLHMSTGMQSYGLGSPLHI